MSEEHELFYWLNTARGYEGIILVETEQLVEGVDRLASAIDTMLGIGNECSMPHWNAFLARAMAKTGRFDEAMDLMSETLNTLNRTEELSSEAEILRIMAEITLMQNDGDAAAEAEAIMLQSIDKAKQQEAKLWELRATTDLARLWGEQGERARAAELLEPVYDWFTEGFDTQDLKDAKELLNELV